MKQFCFLGLLMLSLSAQAQDPAKPGGMQSGSHAAAPAAATAPAAAAAPAGSSAPATAAGAAPVAEADYDVGKLFANTCGWCHSKGGREAGKGPQHIDGILTPQQCADAAFTGLDAGHFCILPHPTVAAYMKNKTADYDRWIGGMAKLQRVLRNESQ